MVKRCGRRCCCATRAAAGRRFTGWEMPQSTFKSGRLAPLILVMVCCEIATIIRNCSQIKGCLESRVWLRDPHVTPDLKIVWGTVDPRKCSLQIPSYDGLSPNLQHRFQAIILWLPAVGPPTCGWKVCLSHTATSVAGPVQHLTSLAVDRCGKPSRCAKRPKERL